MLALALVLVLVLALALVLVLGPGPARRRVVMLVPAPTDQRTMWPPFQRRQTGGLATWPLLLATAISVNPLPTT